MPDQRDLVVSRRVDVEKTGDAIVHEMTPKEVYELYSKGLLLSSQNNAYTQEGVNLAMHRWNVPTKLMFSPSGEVLVIDGHHRVGLAIVCGESLGYVEEEFDPNLRRWPFSNFIKSLEPLLPPGFCS